MLQGLSGRLAAALTAMFVVVGALFVSASQHMPELRRMVELGAELLASSIAFALLVALLVFNVLTRRLERLARAVDAFRDSRFREPRHLGWARPDGDEIDRLAHAFGDLSERISRQLSELAQHDVHRRELLANVSHDLRTPLTLMQGYLETMLLRHGEMSRAEERSCLEVATRHAERLGVLVSDLFDLAKLEGPAEHVERERLSLTELAQDLVQKFALHASAQGILVRSRLCEGPAFVEGNVGLLERALQNLVDNALRHTPQGGRVEVEVACLPGRVVLNVRDTGCGIAADHLPHVFDRYFQAPRVESADFLPLHAAEASRRHHAGLGLAITKRIVVLHGGDIQVSSRVGAGTVFRIELPLAPEEVTVRRGETPCRFDSRSFCPH
jgi:signal transduction histidine kinase